MESTQKLGNNSPNQSDSDDWTLVSPPHSSSSDSPNHEDLSFVSDHSSAILSQSSDDGLTEVDLKLRDDNLRVFKDQGENSGERSGAELTEPGFQALDTTDDDETNTSENQNGKESRRSSLTHSELGEYVDLGGTRLNESLVTLKTDSDEQEKAVVINDDYDEDDGDVESQGSSEHLNSTTELERYGRLTPQNELLCIKSNLDDLCKVVTSKKRKIVLNDAGELYMKRSDTTTLKRAELGQFDQLFSIPSSSQDHMELRLLDGQLAECIKRQSPASFRYYISEDRLKETIRSKSTKDLPPKSPRGLVCYGQETHWRSRIDKLKSEHNIDIREIIHDAKKQIAIETLESQHPLSRFKLIINQIEYLDFIENKRIKKQTEETIKFLKAENLQLLRRLEQPNDGEFQKLLVDLELENSRLQRENAALKANLIKKAGPTYIKQSNELERYERENVILKQFHYQVAQEVSKSLRQFNVYTVDASTLLDSQESLIKQLMLTRINLRKLSEKISTVLIENDGLKEELKETYLTSLAKNEVDSHKTHEIDAYVKDYNQNNNSNALSVDTCMRNLQEARSMTDRLEREVERLKQDCSKPVDVGLERGSSRQMNVTKQRIDLTQDWTPLLGNVNRRQLEAVSTETGLDKRMSDHLSIRNDDILDELMIFLTKLNAKIESSEVAVVDTQEYLAPFRPVLSSQNQQEEAKTIPNYIREASRLSDYNKICKKLTEEPLSNTEKFLMDLIPLITGGKFILTGQKNSSPQEILLSQEDDLNVEETTENKQPASGLADVDLKKTPKIEEQPNLTKENLDVHLPNARDSWIFKRAKQRKQLRHYNNPKASLKRAELREKPDEPISFMEYYYLFIQDFVKGRNHKRKSPLLSKGYKKCKNSSGNRCKQYNNFKQAKQPPEPPYLHRRYSES